MRIRQNSAIGLGLALTICLGSNALSEEGKASATPKSQIDSVGRGTVTFEDGCVVFYDEWAEQLSDNSRCQDDQRRIADTEMSTYRREHGLIDGEQFTGSAPEIFIGEDGFGQVAFASNACVVWFDRYGRDQGALSPCSSAQRSQANVAMATYRRDLGYASPVWRDRYSRPAIVMGKNGYWHVEFDDNCSVYFDRDGVVQSASMYCSHEQQTDAGRAMAQFRNTTGRTGPK